MAIPAAVPKNLSDYCADLCNPLFLLRLRQGIKPIRGLFAFFLCLQCLLSGIALLIGLNEIDNDGGDLSFFFYSLCFFLALFSYIMIPNLIQTTLQEEYKADCNSLISLALSPPRIARSWLALSLTYQGIFWLLSAPVMLLASLGQPEIYNLLPRLVSIGLLACVPFALIGLIIGFCPQLHVAKISRLALGVLFFFLIEKIGWFVSWSSECLENHFGYSITAILLISGFLYQVLLFILRPDTVNRSVPLKIYLTACWLCGVLFLVIPARLSGDYEKLRLWEHLIGGSLSLVLPFMLLGRAWYCRKIRNSLPRNFMLRALLFLFSNGPVAWLLWAICIAFATFGLTGLNPAHWSHSRAFFLSMLVTCLGSLVVWLRHNEEEHWVVTLPDTSTFLRQFLLALYVGLLFLLVAAFSMFLSHVLAIIPGLGSLYLTVILLLLLFMLRPWIRRQIDQFAEISPSRQAVAKHSQGDAYSPLNSRLELAQSTFCQHRNSEEDCIENAKGTRKAATATESIFHTFFGDWTNPLFFSEWGNSASCQRMKWMSMLLLAFQVGFWFWRPDDSDSATCLALLAVILGAIIFNRNVAVTNYEAISVLLTTPELTPKRAVLGWWQAVLYPKVWCLLMVSPSIFLLMLVYQNISWLFAPMFWGKQLSWTFLVAAIRVFSLILFIKNDWRMESWISLDRMGIALYGLEFLFVGSIIWTWSQQIVFSAFLLLGTALFLELAAACLMSPRSNRSLAVKGQMDTIWLLLLVLPLINGMASAISFQSLWILIHAVVTPFLLLDGPGPRKTLRKTRFSSFSAASLAFLRWSTAPGTLTWSFLQVLAIIGMQLGYNFLQPSAPVPYSHEFLSFFLPITMFYLFTLSATMLGARFISNRDQIDSVWNLGTLFGCFTIFAWCCGFLLDYMAIVQIPGLFNAQHYWPILLFLALGSSATAVLLNIRWFVSGWRLFRCDTP